MPSVSVIVPNYDHASFLRQRIDSIVSQTFQDFELIMLDDCSTDWSHEIMESYRVNPHVTHIIFNDKNSGSPFRQWDKGIDMAKGDWIWIAESDDYADPTFLEHMMEEVSKVPACNLAYAATWWVDEPGNKLWNIPSSGEVIKYNGFDFIRQKMAVSNSIANVSECIFRRSAYRPSDNLRYEKMRLCGDWFFYVLIAEQGDVVEVKQPLSYYRQHTSNTSNTAEQQGLTFLEGADVLEYMIEHCGLTSRDYAKGWGHMWANYEQQYHFSKDVKKNVSQRMTKHPMIRIYHQIYRMKRWLK